MELLRKYIYTILENKDPDFYIDKDGRRIEYILDKNGSHVKPGDRISFKLYPRGTSRGKIIIHPKQSRFPVDYLVLVIEDDDGELFTMPGSKGITKLREGKRIYESSDSSFSGIVFNKLVKLAKTYSDFNKFVSDWRGGYRCKYWHLTENRNFSIDPHYIPSDVVGGTGGYKSDTASGGLMVTAHPSQWNKGKLKGDRPWAVEIDLSNLIPNVEYVLVNRGYGSEIMVRVLDKVKIVRTVKTSSAMAQERKWEVRGPHSIDDMEAVWKAAHEERESKNI